MMDRSLIPYQLIGSRTKREGSSSSRLAVCGGFCKVGVPLMRLMCAYCVGMRDYRLSSGRGIGEVRDPGREEKGEQWRCVVHMIAVSKAALVLSSRLWIRRG